MHDLEVDEELLWHACYMFHHCDVQSLRVELMGLFGHKHYLEQMGKYQRGQSLPMLRMLKKKKEGGWWGGGGWGGGGMDTVGEWLEGLLNELGSFLWCSFNAEWQRKYFSLLNLKAVLSSLWVWLYVTYSENV